jgi:site-specific DNA-cytosine methylase
VRGCRRDLEDPRARSLLRLLTVFPEIDTDRLPVCLALENVPGFAGSAACCQLKQMLVGRGYQLRERLLCPTALGVPSRRPRYYLVASRLGWSPQLPIVSRPRPLANFLTAGWRIDPPNELLLSPDVVGRFGAGLRILDPTDPSAYTTCFTAGYGKSLMHAGSYLQSRCGVRRFAPAEIAALLGFPATFRFPAGLPLRKRWHLLGNSVSVHAVRDVLRLLPQIAWEQVDQSADVNPCRQPAERCTGNG